MPGKARCLVRGSINIDEFFHVNHIVQPGETISSIDYERRSGGKGANQAVAVAKAGGAVTLVGAIGSDGGWVLRGLEHTGVDIRPVTVVQNEPTGRAIIQLTPQGENCILLHRGANYASIPEDSIKSTPFTHLLLQNEIPFSSTLSALAHAHQSGGTTLFNPSPMPSAEQLREFPWSQLSWLIVNQGEAFSLLQAFQPDVQKPSPSESIDMIPSSLPSNPDIQAAYKLLHRLRTHPSFSPQVNLVCTLGKLGVVALLSGEDELPVYVPAAKLSGPVRDTTGAGDCFTGYLVAGLMEAENNGKKLDKEVVQGILKTAVEAAGLCVQRPGATESIPYRDELSKLS